MFMPTTAALAYMIIRGSQEIEKMTDEYKRNKE